MRIPGLLAAVLMFAGAVGYATPPQTSPFREPVSVANVSDACGEAVNELDSPPTQVSAANLMKFGWCVGWVQGLVERIVEVHVEAQYEEMIAKKEGKPAPTARLLDRGYMSICLPPEARTRDVIRVIVKGLHAPSMSMQLSEPKSGPVKEVLKRAYPCPAPALEDAKPADAKP
jgi:hypothetical protein